MEKLCSVVELPVVPLFCALFEIEENGAPEYNETDNYFIQNISFPPRSAALVSGERCRR